MTSTLTPQANQRSLVPLVAGAVVLIAIAVGLWLAVSPFLPDPNEKPELASAVTSAVSEAGDGGIVDIRALTAFEWDRMYSFGAYTSDAEVSETLGFPWGTGDDLRLPSDGFVLLIFAEEQRATGWVILNDYRSSGPLVQFDDALLRMPISRDGAVFRATLRADQTVGGWPIYRLRQVG
jgi:hypothetical protein